LTLRELFLRLLALAILFIFLAWISCENIAGPPAVEAGETASGAPIGEKPVVRVTTLADSGEGSLRQALELTKTPRRIVFDIAGTIELGSAIAVRNPHVTVDGLSAPAPGITLKHYGLKIRTHDVSIHHVRIHVGDGNKEHDPNPGDHDAIDIAGNNEGMPVRNILIDHCSLYWATDETACTWSANFSDKVSDVVFSNCIFAESLLNSIHPDGAHSCGPFIGYNSKRIHLVRNLIAHCADRTPNISGGTETIIVNNVIYDPWKMFIHVNNLHKVDQPKTTIIGNVCIKGPSARDELRHSIRLTDLSEGAEIYVYDNPCEAYVPYDHSTSVTQNMPGSVDVIVDEPPVWDDSIVVLPSSAVEDAVLENVGARPHDRDWNDTRLIQQVRNRAGKIIDSQADVQ